jgi:MFS family permease
MSQDLNPTSKPASRLFYGYIVAVAGFIIMGTMYSSRYAFGVFFKPVLTDFGWTRAMTSGALSLSLLMEGLLGIVMGAITDKFGPRAVLTFCGVLLGIGGFLMSRIHAIWQIYLFLGIIIGIGMSGAWVPVTSTIARWFFRRRGFMSGFVLTGTGVAALLTPPLADWLIAAYGWRNAFSIMGIGALVIVVLTAQLMKRDPSRMGLLPESTKIERVEESIPNDIGLTFREAISTNQFWLVNIMLFSFGFCMFTVVVHIVPHATDLNISGSTAAKILGLIGGAVIIGRLFLGMLADRIGSRWIFIIGFILMPIGFFWLVPAREAWMMFLFAGTFGLAQGGMGTAESPLVAEIFGLRSHGLIYGAMGIGFMSGAATGPWLAGYIFDIMGSYRLDFVICSSIGLLGLFFTGLLKPIKEDRTRP